MTFCSMHTAGLSRLRQALGIPGAGSGLPITYDERTANVIVTLWHAREAFGKMSKSSSVGMTQELQTLIGKQLMVDDEALVSHGILDLSVKLVVVYWPGVVADRLAPTHKMALGVSR